MALSDKKIAGLRAMYHNAASTQGEKDNAKSILEANGVSVDEPKKQSPNGGAGPYPNYQKGGFDRSGPIDPDMFDFKTSFRDGDNNFDSFFKQSFSDDLFWGREPGRTDRRSDQERRERKRPNRVIICEHAMKEAILRQIEAQVRGGTCRLDSVRLEEGRRIYHFEGLTESQERRIIEIYKQAFGKLQTAALSAIQRELKNHY